MSGDDLSTADAELVPLAPVHDFLELRLASPRGEKHLPFLKERLEFPVGETLHWVELQDNGEVRFSTGQAAGLDQRVPLSPDTTARVVDLRTLPPFWLVGLTPRLAHRRWPISFGENLIGRAGKRRNQVLLCDPSVSRSHARLLVHRDGTRLLAESSALTAVNGTRLAAGDSVELMPDDVLQLGELHLRWLREEKASSPDTLQLELLGLGRATVRRAQRELILQSEKVKDILFWLASYRGAPLSVKTVMDEYWPDRPTLRQRKNLSHLFKSLQNELGLQDLAMARLVHRTTDTLTLDVRAVSVCDFWQLRLACEQKDRSHLCTAYRGPFMPDNDRPWAHLVRREQFIAWLAALEQCSLQEEQKATVLERITRTLRECQFQEFVYQAACRLAQSWGAGSYAQLWLAELAEMENNLSETARKPSL